MRYAVGAFGAQFGHTCCYVVADPESPAAVVIDPGQGSLLAGHPPRRPGVPSESGVPFESSVHGHS